MHDSIGLLASTARSRTRKLHIQNNALAKRRKKVKCWLCGIALISLLRFRSMRWIRRLGKHGLREIQVSTWCFATIYQNVSLFSSITATKSQLIWQPHSKQCNKWGDKNERQLRQQWIRCTNIRKCMFNWNVCLLNQNNDLERWKQFITAKRLRLNVLLGMW